MTEYFNLAPTRRPAARRGVSPPSALHPRPQHFSLTSLAAVRRVQPTGAALSPSLAPAALQPAALHHGRVHLPGHRAVPSLALGGRGNLTGPRTVPLPPPPHFSPPWLHSETGASAVPSPSYTPPDAQSQGSSRTGAYTPGGPPPAPLLQTKVLVRRPQEDNGGSVKENSLLSRVCNVSSACRGQRVDSSSGLAFCWGDPSTQPGNIVESSVSSSSGFSADCYGIPGDTDGDDVAPNTWHKTLRDPGCNTPGSPRPWRPGLTVPDGPALATAQRNQTICRSRSEPPEDFQSFREQTIRFAHSDRASPLLLSRSLAPAASATADRSRTASSPGKKSPTKPQAPALATEGRNWLRIASPPSSPRRGGGRQGADTPTSPPRGGGRPVSPRRVDFGITSRLGGPAASPAAKRRVSPPKASPKPSPRPSPCPSPGHPRGAVMDASPKASPRASPCPSPGHPRGFVMESPPCASPGHPKQTPKSSPCASPRVRPMGSPRSSPRSSPRPGGTRRSPHAVDEWLRLEKAVRQGLPYEGKRKQGEPPKPQAGPGASFNFRVQIGDKQPWQALSSNTPSGKGQNAGQEADCRTAPSAVISGIPSDKGQEGQDIGQEVDWRTASGCSTVGIASGKGLVQQVSGKGQGKIPEP